MTASLVREISSLPEGELEISHLPEDPAAVAQEAGLHYDSDSSPGIRREKDGDGFRFLDPRGRVVTDEKTLERITKVALVALLTTPVKLISS